MPLQNTKAVATSHPNVRPSDTPQTGSIISLMEGSNRRRSEGLTYFVCVKVRTFKHIFSPETWTLITGLKVVRVSVKTHESHVINVT